MKHVLIIGCGILIPLIAQARFAEPASQCDKRYGKPKSVKIQGTDQVRWYEKQGFTIEAVFHSGRVVEIFYSRTGGGPLTKNELLALLSVNVGESRWQKVDQVSEWKRRHRSQAVSEDSHRELMDDLATYVLWTRKDGNAEASYDRESGVLYIGDAKRLAEERMLHAEKERMPPTLEGF